MKKEEPELYICRKTRGSPQTFIEIYGKNKFFEMKNRGYLKIDGYSLKNWSITERGEKEIEKSFPRVCAPRIIRQIKRLLKI